MNNIPPEVKKNIEEQASMYADRYADRENFMIAYNAYLSGVLYAIEDLPKISSSVQGGDVVYVGYRVDNNAQINIGDLYFNEASENLETCHYDHEARSCNTHHPEQIWKVVGKCQLLNPSSLQPIPSQRTYDESIKYWQSVIAFLNEYRDIVAPGCKENLFLSDFLARQLEAKFYKPIPEPVSVGEEVQTTECIGGITPPILGELVISVPWCYKCNPEQSAVTRSPRIEGIYQCSQCGNRYDIPSGKFIYKEKFKDEFDYLGKIKMLEEQIEDLKNSKVYSHPDCPFNYCDSPDKCKINNECRHRPSQDSKQQEKQ